MTKNILVASKNPVKIRAAQTAFEKVFYDHEIQCDGISVDSGVPDQPVGVEQTLEGAKNRVGELKMSGREADYFVGMEGGICYIDKHCYAFAWMYLESVSGQQGQSMTGYFELPPEVVSLLEGGKELGHAMDRVFSLENTKQTSGAVGLLTNERIDRTDYYVHAMVLALIPFLQVIFYKNPEK